MNKFFDALWYMSIGAGLLFVFWMATHNCYTFKTDALLCTRHPFDMWSVFK